MKGNDKETSMLKLEHNGITIRNSVEEGDSFLNLTDMWKACGSDPSKKPTFWLRDAGKDFVEFIAETQGLSVDQLLRKQPGNPRTGDGGSTLAHWQIGLAYAKYLSHEFHAKCNTIVREYIEGRRVTEQQAKELEQFVRTLPANRPKQWDWDIADIFSDLYGKKPTRRRYPPWMRMIIKKLTDARIPKVINDETRRLAQQTGARYYNHYQDQLVALLPEMQFVAVGIAKKHTNPRTALNEVVQLFRTMRGLGTQLDLLQNNECSQCGSSLQEGDRFCSKCGNRV